MVRTQVVRMEESKVLWRGILAAFPVQDHESSKFVRKLLFEGPTRKSGKVNGRTVSVLPAAGADNSKNGRQATPENRGYRREPEKKCE